MIVEKGKPLSKRQVKQRIKEIRGWSEARYKKESELVRRGLERAGQQVDVQKFLFTESKAISRYKSTYKPSSYARQVRSLGKINAKVRQIKGKRQLKRNVKSAVAMQKSTYVEQKFAGLINANPGAMKIYTMYRNDPHTLEKKLIDYANKLHAKIDEQDRVIAAQAIPFSTEMYGSDVEIY